MSESSFNEGGSYWGAKELIFILLTASPRYWNFCNRTFLDSLSKFHFFTKKTIRRLTKIYNLTKLSRSNTLYVRTLSPPLEKPFLRSPRLERAILRATAAGGCTQFFKRADTYGSVDDREESRAWITVREQRKNTGTIGCERCRLVELSARETEDAFRFDRPRDTVSRISRAIWCSTLACALLAATANVYNADWPWLHARLRAAIVLNVQKLTDNDACHLHVFECREYILTHFFLVERTPLISADRLTLVV